MSRPLVLPITFLLNVRALAGAPIWSDYDGARGISMLVSRDDIETWAEEHPNPGTLAFEDGYIVPDMMDPDNSRRIAYFAPAEAGDAFQLVATWTRSADGKTSSLSTATDDALVLTPELIATTLRAMRKPPAETSTTTLGTDTGPAKKRSLFLQIADAAVLVLFSLPFLGALLWVVSEAAIRLGPWRKRLAAARRAKRSTKDSEQFSARMEGTARQSEDSLAAAEREFHRVINEMHNAVQEITR
jgi:hypothetical protein